MKKRLLSLALAMLLALCLCIPAAAYGTEYIFDTVGLLSQEELDALEAQAEALSRQYGCGIYTVIVDDYYAYGDSVSLAAQRIFEDNGFGLGEQQNGIILLLSMADRDYSISVSGETAEYAFTSYGREQLADEFLGALGQNDWAGAIRDYITAGGAYLDLAERGAPVRKSPVRGILFGSAIGCFAAFVVCMLLKGKMASVRRGTLAREYVAPGGLTLTEHYDHYTHTTETRRTIKDDSDSGSSGSKSSSGSSTSGKF